MAVGLKNAKPTRETWKWKKTGADHQSQPAKVHDVVKVCCIQKHYNDIVVISIKMSNNFDD